MNFTISIDDGSPHDWRIAELLNKYKLRATFYWSRSNPKHEVMSEEDMLNFIKTYPHMDIQQHTYNHKLLTQLLKDEWQEEIILGKMWHQTVFKTNPVGFAYPRGYLSPAIADFLHNEGYKYARTVKNQNQLQTHMKMYEMDGSLHFYQGKVIDHGGEKMEVKSLILHSWEIEKFNDWHALEKSLSFLDSSLCLTNTETYKMIYENSNPK